MSDSTPPINDPETQHPTVHDLMQMLARLPQHHRVTRMLTDETGFVRFNLTHEGMNQTHQFNPKN
jgi:hypothetical protein